MQVVSQMKQQQQTSEWRRSFPLIQHPTPYCCSCCSFLLMIVSFRLVCLSAFLPVALHVVNDTRIAVEETPWSFAVPSMHPSSSWHDDTDEIMIRDAQVKLLLS